MILAEIFPYAKVLYDILTVLYVLTVLAVIVVILGENRNPVKSIAWVLVLVLLPVAGLVIYLVFGRSLKGKTMITRSGLRELRRDNDFPVNEECKQRLNDSSRQLISMVDKLVGKHLFVGNRVDIFTSGQEKFDALLRDIEQATDYIHVQYFIIKNDSTGGKFISLLEQKAQEGVKVRVLYDYLGSFYFRPKLLKRMREAGVDIRPFLELTFTQLANRLNWRNHRKVVVIDGKVGYVGGMNLADRYVIGDKNWAKPWRDTHLRIWGEAVAALQYSFAIDWHFTTRELLSVKTMRYEQRPTSPNEIVQIVSSGPTNRWNNISYIFLKAITSAKESVYIETPYFLPSDALLKSLQSVALSGIDVRLLIPEKLDSEMLRLATGSYIKQCLQAGIKVYFYQPTMMHAKMIVVDDEFVTTGSTNFDFRSFEHNFECNALIYSKDFNSKMRDIFMEDLQQSTRVTMGKWKQRPLLRKAFESVVRLISPIL